MSADPGAQNGSKPFWTIGQVQDRPVLNDNGVYVEGRSVEVRFWDGSTTTLLYPRSQYNPDTVAQAAQAAADTHMRVKALQGPLLPPEIIAGTY